MKMLLNCFAFLRAIQLAKKHIYHINKCSWHKVTPIMGLSEISQAVCDISVKRSKREIWFSSDCLEIKFSKKKKNTDKKMFTNWRIRYQKWEELGTSDLLPIHFIITKDIYDTQVERLSMVLTVWVCSNKESYLVDLAVKYMIIFSV